MIRLNPGVRIGGVQPEIALALSIMNSVMEGEELIVTCCMEGQHRTASLHYIGHAVDIRSRTLKDAKATVARFKQALGDDFDVVLEATHIHVEFQPKKPLNKE